ncbi:protein kinase domain-containing protein [Micromonospora sp. CA-263727]|uniref:protein kinase domain-containing protein n=1 Tax=Micromonospora sp. CA-263727 TaxID=3239967 RepID=UPI003D8CB596
MGRVWQARDETLQRDVAIKELVPPPGLTDDERHEMRERSMREARAVARLGHVNVVRVFDVLLADGDPWIVMELIQSRSLHQVLAAGGPMEPTRAAHVGLGVLGALRAAHAAGILHRDVKPANVLIAEDGRVVLTDFGLATLPGDPRVTRTGLVLGSPAYLAPERATDGVVGPAADLWSLGATLYAAVEGRTPYNRSSPISTLAALATELPPPPQRAGPLSELLAGLLRRDPEERISAEDAERILRRVAGPIAPIRAAGPARVGLPVAGADAADGAARPRITPEFRAGAAPAAPAGVAGAAFAPANGNPTGGGPANSNPANSNPAGGGIAGSGGSAPHGSALADPAVGVRRRRRRGLLVGSLTAALLLALLVGGSLRGGGPFGGTEPDPAARPTELPDVPVSQLVSPPPAGWHYYRGDPAFQMPVPDGWTPHRADGRVEFREPTGPRFVVVGELRKVPASPLAELRAREKSERPRYDDYQRVRLATVGYQAGAADWEWTHTADDGTRMHTLRRTFLGHNGRAYLLGWGSADAEWSASQRTFALFSDGFQALPPAASWTRRAPGGPTVSGPASARPAATPGGTGTTGPANPGQAGTTAPPSASPAAGNTIIGFASDRCIDIPEGKAYVGARLHIWDCHRSAKQLWTFPGDGTVRSMGKCLDVAGGSTQDGAAIQLSDCTGTGSQKFTLNNAHDLVNVRADRCVDVAEQSTANGARLHLWQCNGKGNQKWKLG